MPYLGNFTLKLKKTIFIFDIGTLEFVNMQIFVKKNKVRIRMPYLGIFRLKFEETIVIFEISTFECVKM